MCSGKSITVAAVTILVAYSFVYGWDCLMRSPEESFRDAERVFVGRVISIKPAGLKQEVNFEVKRALKGDTSAHSSLYQMGTVSDFEFVRGETYLVYATRRDGQLSASACSATKAYEERFCGTRTGRGFRFFERLDPRFSYDEIAVITAISVSLSLAVGFGVTRLWRRLK